MKRNWLQIFSLTLISIYRGSASPLTTPLTSDGEIGKVIPTHFESKKFKSYHEFAPNQNYTLKYLDVDRFPSCDIEFNLQWSHNVGNPIYSTPVIFPGTTDLENKNIFISTYFNNVELFEGDGTRPLGWPISFHNSIFQSSPLVFDIDGDGNTDIGVTDEAGNLFWIRVGQYGTYLDDYHIQIPKLRIRKDWMDLMKTEDQSVYVSFSKFDRRGQGIQPREWMNTTKSAKIDTLSAPLKPSNAKTVANENNPDGRKLEEILNDFDSPPAEEGEEGGGLEIDHGEGGGFSEEEDPDGYIHPDPDFEFPSEEELSDFRRRFQEAENENNNNIDPNMGEEPGFQMDPEDQQHAYSYSAKNFVKSGDDAFSYYMTRRYGYAPEGDDKTFVNVDPHVLTTPAMADINRDGHMEVNFHFLFQNFILIIVLRFLFIFFYFSDCFSGFVFLQYGNCPQGS
jgi:hypothetical protein